MANMNFGVNILPKANNTYTLGNSDYKWNIFANTINGASVLTDVQVSGTSIVNNGVASLPEATTSQYGLVRLFSGGALQRDSTTGAIKLDPASSAEIKAATSGNRALAPYRQHESVFYGLAKAAGDSTQSASSNAVGTYTSQAQSAIRNMLAAAPKSNPFFTGTISLGRYYNSADQSDEANTIGTYSIAVGNNVAASGESSQAFGQDTYAVGWTAHAEGRDTAAYGNMSHTEGIYTLTEDGAWASHAEGSDTIANTPCVHVGGQYNSITDLSLAPTWTANTSYTVGDIVKHEETNDDDETHNYVYRCITANNDATFDYGKWITWEDVGDFAEIIGNGGYINDDPLTELRSNARALDWQGNEYLNGYLYVGCNANSGNGIRVPHDIQINGTSIVSNGVANIPLAARDTLGAVMINGYGLWISSENGLLATNRATPEHIKAGTQEYRPIVPYNQHEAVFYGLAKAAGDSTQSASSNAVGTYTDTAKAAIQSMLGIQYDNQLSNTSTNPLQNRTINAALQKKVDLISDTFTANPVIFNSTIGDMSLKSIIINQKPIYSGSSDPSPTNIRPITGINKIILNHSGKNLLDPDDLVNKNYGGNNNLYNVRPEHLIPIVPGASMVLQGLAVNETNIRFYDAEGNYQSGYTISYYGIGIETFTVPSDSYYCLPKWYRSDTELTIEEVAAVSMLYYGTESSDFVPYNSSTSYTIILPGLGKNLCSPVIKGVSIGGDNGTESTSATRATTNFIPVDFTANPNYRFSGLPNSLTMWVNAYDSNLRSLGRTSSDKRTNYTISANKFNQGTIIGTGNIAYIRLTFSAGTNDDINDVDSAQIQLEIGDTTTTYESYDNTLYGGTFNITTGTLTVNRVSKTYTGASDENWNVQNTDTGINFYIMTPNTWKWDTGINDFLCNMAASTDSLINGTARITYTGNLNVCIGSLINISTVEAFKEWLSTHNLQIVTTLVQPYTISLSPLEVKVLKNINTFASNANGIITVENYIDFESFKDYIDDRTVQDVKINGTSIVNNNVVTIPIATNTTPGVIIQGPGLTMQANKLWILKATSNHIKNGAEEYCPIVPASQHRATFYGLAKAAGDSTQAASDNAVGTYTADAKSAIQNMLAVAPTANPVFTGSMSLGRKANTTVAARSLAFGNDVEASNMDSQAFGNNTIASGYASHAEGTSTTASGAQSHSEGIRTTASGNNSHSEGSDTIASGSQSHAEGCGGTYTISGTTYTSGAKGMADHSEGYKCLTGTGLQGNHAEGYQTRATGGAAHSEGDYTLASGLASHAEGIGGTFTLNGTTYTSGAKGNSDHAEGYQCLTEQSMPGNHAEGYQTRATGGGAHSEGYWTLASGLASHAEGNNTVASQQFSHAEGQQTVAAGANSHVSGQYNVIDSYSNWSEWVANTSYSVGDKVKRTSSSSVAAYICKTANSDSTFTSGNWTAQNGKMNYAEIIGNGLAANNKSNARVLDWDGNERLKGNIYVGCNADSTGGTMLTPPVVMTGATSSAAGTAGYAPAPATTDVDKFLAGDGTYKSGGLPMVILSYGNSTWAEFEAAYNNNVIVYCRASSNSNPATGSQTRMAFMAYVNNATTPTEVEFQYYRSMSSHSATAMGDQVFVYKLTKTGGWSVTTRDASIKQIKADTGTALGVSWSSNVVTLTNTMTADDMPMSSSDATTAKAAIDGKININQGVANAGKFLVVNSSGNVEAITLQEWQGGNY